MPGNIALNKRKIENEAAYRNGEHGNKSHPKQKNDINVLPGDANIRDQLKDHLRSSLDLPSLNHKNLPQNGTIHPSTRPLGLENNTSRNISIQKDPAEHDPRAVLSEGDAEFVDDQKEEIRKVLFALQNDPNNHKKENEAEECLICFDKKPNAVIMNCGHGGLCFECAIKHWDKSTECHICRRVIHFPLLI